MQSFQQDRKVTLAQQRLSQTLVELKLESRGQITMRELLGQLQSSIDFKAFLRKARISETEIYYKFFISDNNITWMQQVIYIESIRKTVAQFQELDQKIRKYSRIQDLVPIEHLKRNQSEFTDNLQIQDELINYIRKLLQHVHLKHLRIVRTFLSDSDVQVIGNRKYKETYLKKRSGGRHKETCIRKMIQCYNQWKKRYFVITSEGVMVARKEFGPDAQVREMLLFDFNFQVEFDPLKTGLSNNGIIIRTNTRNLCLEAYDQESFIFFLIDLLEAYQQCSSTSLHRFNSFAPLRNQVNAEWFVDGDRYFDSVCDSFMGAKNEIFITDWWLSPQLYLKRPVGKKFNQEFRLDRVLQRKAKEGVKIYIIIYNEHKIALAINSEYTQRYLMSLHPNITVLRHPSQILPQLWSHHEKVIVVDQLTAYVGGLDLCYGRMDTQSHEIHDPDQKNIDGEDCLFYPGIDYSNVRLRDFKDVIKYETSDVMRNEDPRMPWHDVSFKLQGSVVRDVCRHFIQYWNFACIDQYKKGQFNILQLQQEHLEEYKEDEKLWTKHDYKDQVVKWFNKTSKKFKKTFLKPDDQQDQFQEFPVSEIIQKGQRSASTSALTFDFNIDKALNSQEKKQQEQVRKKSARRITMDNNKNSTLLNPLLSDQSHMDLYIEQMSSQNDYKEQEELLQQQAQLQNDQNTKKQQKSTTLDGNVLKMLVNQRNVKDQSGEQFLTNQQQLKHSTITNKELSQAHKQEKKILLSYNKQQVSFQGTSTVQVCRSSSNWSLGLNLQNPEYSILIAYLELISQAQHFIYIENQFFISSSSLSGEQQGFPIQNQIALALVQRIKRAANNREIFKVVVVMPLLPGFEGEIDTDNSNVMKIQLYWEYLSISRGGKSIIEQLAKDPNVKDPQDYIVFIGLRTHGIINNKPQTEIIYVHSKLMIVDDMIALCGSANINDRSMMGSRDSEIAVVVEDQKKVSGTLALQPTEFGVFSHTLRKNLYHEHFGIPLDSPLLDDPADPELHQFILDRIQQNTNIYRDIFACYPDDTISELRQLNGFREKQNLQNYVELSGLIKGHAVQLPTKFLKDEDLRFPALSKERILPEISFT